MNEIDPSNLPVAWQGILSGIGVIISVLGYDRWKVYRSGTKEATAGNDASSTQYNALEKSIAQHTEQLKSSFEQIAELRSEMAIMDKTIHVQQIEITQQAMMITRMDGVISLLVALLSALGQPVPERVQREIDSLVDLQNRKAETARLRRKNDNLPTVPRSEIL